MNELDIVAIIKDIEKQHKAYKDGGMTFIKHLAQKVLNTVDEDKVQIFDFLVKEIEQNKHGLFSIALQTIIELKSLELAPAIEKIFIQNRNSKDEVWKYSLIEALLKLNYAAPTSLYYDFITNYLKNNPNKGYFILVQYCNVDPEKGLPLLSDFYSKFFLENSEMKSFLESRIGFLVNYFIQNPEDYLYELNKLVLLKNKDAGRHLKKALLDYFNSSMAEKYPNDLIEKEKKSLCFLKA